MTRRRRKIFLISLLVLLGVGAWWHFWFRTPKARVEAVLDEMSGRRSFAKDLLERLGLEEPRHGHAPIDYSWALAAIGPRAVPRLIQALSDPGSQVRATAAHALERLGPQARAALPDLVQALMTDNDHDVQAYAAAALSAIGPESVPDPILFGTQVAPQ